MLGLLKLSAEKSRNVEPIRHSLPLGIKANDAQSEPVAGRGGLVTLNVVCRVKKLDGTIRSRQVRRLVYLNEEFGCGGIKFSLFSLGCNAFERPTSVIGHALNFVHAVNARRCSNG